MDRDVYFFLIRATEIPRINVEIKKQKLIQLLQNHVFDLLETQDIVPNIYISSTYNLFTMNSAIIKLFNGYDIPINIDYLYSYEIYNSILDIIKENLRIKIKEQEGQIKKIFIIDMDAIATENINNTKIYYTEKQKIITSIKKNDKFLKIQNI